MSITPLRYPGQVAELCKVLAGMKGVEAVAIGGSRAAATEDAASDWDLGVYYRRPIELAALERYGEVHPPGAWGRIMNGGAWLSIGGIKVDVLLRDLDVVLRWVARAKRGVYEVDALLGYLAGAPTYSLMAELAMNRTTHGRLPEVGNYPEPLSRAGKRRWRLSAEFSLAHAKTRAERGDIIGTVGQAAKAIMEIAHATACARHFWVINEKRLLESCGLQDLQDHLTEIPTAPPKLLIWVDRLQTAIERALP